MCLPLILHGQSPNSTPRQPGVLADTVSAPPLTLHEKFTYRMLQSFSLRGLVGAAFSAAIGQATNTPSEWGQGAEGFGDRYGSSFGGSLARETFEFGLEGALHEDPRYFPSEEKTFKPRLLNVFKQTFICKTDSGGNSFAYARVISAFATGQLVNAWQPKSTDSFGHGITRGFISIGIDAGLNFAQEFLPFARPKSMRHKP